MLCSGIHSIAASVPVFMVMDTSIDRSAYALSQDQFLEKYGRDDSSKALINYFFRKRTAGQGMAAGGGFISILAALGFAAATHVVNNSSGYDLNEQVQNAVWAFFTGIVLAGGITLISIGIVSWGRHSRKRLLLLLDNYFAGSPIPKGIAKKKVFRAFVQYGAWNDETRKDMRSADRDRKRRSRN